MTASTLKEARLNLIKEAQALLPKDNKTLTANVRNSFDDLMLRVDEMQRDIERAERIEALSSEHRGTGRPPRSQPGEHLGGNELEREKRAFRDWMRTGRISDENRPYLKEAEARDLGVGAIAGSITGGNVLVPTGFDPLFHTALKSYGAIVGAVRQFKTDDGRPVRVALNDDTAASLTVISEATAVSESDPTFSGFTSYTDEMTTGLIRVSNGLMADSAFSVDGFIQDMFARRYFTGLSKFITLGNGSNFAPITAGATLGATTEAPGYIDLASLIQCYGALDPVYLENSSFLMAASTRAALMNLVTTTGAPILQTDLTGQPFNALFGRPIVLSAFSDPIAPGKTPILFGDLSTYTLRTVGSLQVARLTERYAEMNETGFIGFCRAGGYNTSQASSPALVSLKMHA